MRGLVVLVLIGLVAQQAKAFENGACDIATRPAIIGVGDLMHTPNYPDAEYNPDSHCEWILDFGPLPGPANLIFNPFTLEGCSNCSACDFVEIIDGPDFIGPSLGQWCGTEAPPAMQPTAQFLSIRFTSDASMQLGGFEAMASTVDVACTPQQPAIIRQPGDMSSPNYPGNYANMEACSWLVNAPTNDIISFQINDLGIEDCCTCDYVEVFDGADASAVRLGRFYADDTPPMIISTTDLLFIQFVSDYSITGTGFQATIDFIIP